MTKKNYLETLKSVLGRSVFHYLSQTVGGQEGMGVVTEVLEKVVGINSRTLAVPFVGFSNSSQSF